MNEILPTIIPLIGALIGTFAGIITSTKLTNYRLEQLEKKVDKHNSLVERMYKIEERVTAVEKGVK